MGPYLESLLTFLAEFSILYILSYALVGALLVGVLIYYWLREQRVDTKFLLFLPMIFITPMILSALPDEAFPLISQTLPGIQTLMGVALILYLVTYLWSKRL